MSSPGLARFVASAPGDRRAPPPERDAESCELCGGPVAAGHDHLVDVGSRALLCSCRACALLFTNPGAGAGRYRVVPERRIYHPGFDLGAGEWEQLQIPVGLAFFFRNSALDRWAAFYPSPAGATESVLGLQAWEAVMARNPELPHPADDVEAVLVRRAGPAAGAYLVPVTVCYTLVGLVRIHWRGFDGGTAVHTRIDRFFVDLAGRAERIGRA